MIHKTDININQPTNQDCLYGVIEEEEEEEEEDNH